MAERKRFELSKCVKVSKRLYNVGLQHTQLWGRISLSLTILSGILPSITVYLLQKIMNGIQAKDISINALLASFGLYAGLGFVTIVASGLQSIVGAKMSNELDLQLNQVVLDKIEKFELQDFEDSTMSSLAGPTNSVLLRSKEKEPFWRSCSRRWRLGKGTRLRFM